MAWYKPKDILKKNKRVITAVATGGLSETVAPRFVTDPAREGLKEITGVNAMEDANKEAQRRYEEEKAAAEAEEQAATDAAYASIEKDRRRRAAMRGRSSTILTGSLGESGLTVSRKTLLGA